jgi:hypothetical protein
MGFLIGQCYGIVTNLLSFGKAPQDFCNETSGCSYCRKSHVFSTNTLGMNGEAGVKRQLRNC